jgi:hypothetical protein
VHDLIAHPNFVREGLRIKGGDEWQVKSILEARESEGGGREFKVDWAGNWHPTWEPQEYLEHCQDKIDAFLKPPAPANNRKGARGRKRKKKK